MELKSLVEAARNGDLQAYGQIVERFQDMAYGFAYAVLGDFHLAQDVAQEAFIEAFRQLPALREPAAFPGWFRRIVAGRCHRLARARKLNTVPLEEAAQLAGDHPSPSTAAATTEMKNEVLAALQSLPSAHRQVTALYYINGYTTDEIAGFLEVPLTTVKKRLHDSRRKLRERMLAMTKDAIQSQKPDAQEAAEQIRFLLVLPGRLQQGVPVLQALHEAREQARSSPIKQMVAQLIASVENAGTFAEVMERYPRLFPPMVIALIRDGERFGVLDETMRMAGGWLQRGTFAAPPDLFTKFNPCVANLIQRARKAGATEVILDSSQARILEHGPTVPAFRAEFVMPSGKREEDFLRFVPEQMPAIEKDLKQCTILDQRQRGDAIRGILRIKADSGRRQGKSRRITYRPLRDGLEIRISVS